MSAAFRWMAATPKARPSVGDTRVMTKFLLLPKKLDGQWRWLGFEHIDQEFKRYRVWPPEMRPMDVVGWRDVGWTIR